MRRFLGYCCKILRLRYRALREIRVWGRRAFRHVAFVSFGRHGFSTPVCGGCHIISRHEPPSGISRGTRFAVGRKKCRLEGSSQLQHAACGYREVMTQVACVPWNAVLCWMVRIVYTCIPRAFDHPTQYLRANGEVRFTTSAYPSVDMDSVHQCAEDVT